MGAEIKLGLDYSLYFFISTGNEVILTDQESVVISVSPSSSLSPTLCYDITIVISFGENTTLEEGVTTWELYGLESGDIIQTQGPLNASELYYLYIT